ncbi:hypothetical protein ACQ4WP_10160 [Janthinobacterium sp. GB4P2]|uniref:hypothetical protein n=1 Tax=Janthinobacterium sp. GB4P2 TaxID=3424189 RepID=UPI003F234698
MRTPGLNGSYPVPQALASGERSYVLRKAGTASPAAPIAATLGEVARSRPSAASTNWCWA